MTRHKHFWLASDADIPASRKNRWLRFVYLGRGRQGAGERMEDILVRDRRICTLLIEGVAETDAREYQQTVSVVLVERVWDVRISYLISEATQSDQKLRG